MLVMPWILQRGSINIIADTPSRQNQEFLGKSFLLKNFKLDLMQ